MKEKQRNGQCVRKANVVHHGRKFEEESRIYAKNTKDAGKFINYMEANIIHHDLVPAVDPCHQCDLCDACMYSAFVSEICVMICCNSTT